VLSVFVLVYILATILVGFYANRLVKTSADFVQAGRRLPAVFNATALFALWFGSETVFGASSRVLEEGLIGVIEDPFGGFLCLILFGLFLARRLYRLNLLTLGDLFRNRYGKRVEIAASVFMLITFFGYIAAQIVALAVVFDVILPLNEDPDINFSLCLILGSVLVTFYTFIGGMWAVTITDFIQSFFIVAGLIAVSVYLASIAGGFDVVINSAPEGFFKFFPEREPVDITNWIAAWLVLGLGSIPSQDIFQRMNSAKSEKAAVSSFYIGAGFYLFFAMFPLFIALASKVIYPEQDFSDTQQVIPNIVLAHTPFFVQVLFFGSIISAIMSTCSGAILAPASILSENLIKPLSRKKYTDKEFLFLVRISVVIIALISTVMAYMRSDIFELVAESSVLGIVSLLTPMLAALFWKKASSSGAMLSMFFGIGSWIVFRFFIEIAIEGFIPSLAISIAALILGSYLFPSQGDSAESKAT
jgi:solute:Na+ symporter, SSS family